MDTKKATSTALLAILAFSLLLTPLAFAITPSSNYPFELVGRNEYVAPSGTVNPFVSVAQTSIHITVPPLPAMTFTWVPASSYSTSPGHGL